MALLIVGLGSVPSPASGAWGPHGIRLSTSNAPQDLSVAVSDGAGGSTVIVTGPPPTVTAVAPGTALDTASAQPLSVNGTNFQPGAAVSLVRGGVSLPATNVQVNPPGLVFTAEIDLRPGSDGFWDMRVENPDGGVGVLTSAFRIDQRPLPVSIAPNDGSDTETRDVVVTGSRFVSGCQLALTREGVPSIEGELESVNPAGTQVSGRFNLSDAAVGVWNVIVRHPAGLATGLLADAFTVFAGPRITLLTPGVSELVPDVSVTVHGSGFQSGAQVTFESGGFPVIVGTGEVTSVEGTEVAVTFDLSSVSPGVRNVRVQNPDGRSATRLGGFTIVTGPSIQYVDPSAAGDTGVAIVTIHGSGFASGVTARLQRSGQSDIVGNPVTPAPDGNTIAAGFDLEGKQLGSWNVTVQNPSGTSATLAGAFQIIYGGPTFPSGLDLTWQACNLPLSGGTLAVLFDCADPEFANTLHANFQSPVSLGAFVALDAVIDIRLEGNSVPPFWRFDPIGCNADGLILADARPPACPGSSNRNPWGLGGASSDAYITAYAPGFSGPGTARMLVSIFRASNDPFPLVGGENYFGFTLTWTGSLTGCDGCNTLGEIIWTSAMLHSANSLPGPVSLSGTGQRSQIVQVNQGTTSTHLPRLELVSGIRSIAPNPVAGRARIELAVARPGPVRLTLLDLQGREVALVVDRTFQAGVHLVTWEGRGDGGTLPAGVYFLRFDDGARSQVTRLALTP